MPLEQQREVEGFWHFRQRFVLLFGKRVKWATHGLEKKLSTTIVVLGAMHHSGNVLPVDGQDCANGDENEAMTEKRVGHNFCPKDGCFYK